MLSPGKYCRISLLSVPLREVRPEGWSSQYMSIIHSRSNNTSAINSLRNNIIYLSDNYPNFIEI